MSRKPVGTVVLGRNWGRVLMVEGKVMIFPV
jgi:hypothetical protein